FIGLMVAEELKCDFVYAARFQTGLDKLFPIEYEVPLALRETVKGKRVAIVNDVINAGSAVRGAYQDVQDAGAKVVAIATLVLLGDAFSGFAQQKGVALQSLAQLPNELW